MKIIILILAVLMITGCINSNVTKEVEIIKEDFKDISVYFCPRDDCEGELSKFILSAKEYVHCAFFDLDLEDVMEALERVNKKGVDVKLIIDSDNYDLVENMSISIKQDYRSAFMHNKFCIIDGVRISSGSMNPTFTGNGKNNNNLIFIESYNLAENYETEFQEMWNGVFGRGDKNENSVFYLDNTKIENYFCSEDNCGERIKAVLREAEKSIYFMTFSFTHDSIANILLLKNFQGVHVAGIFEKRGTGSEYSRFNVLDYQDVKVFKDNSSGVMHHKVFIIDNKIVITGSFNPSNNADNNNDENILIIHNKAIAKKYLEEFKYIYEDYTER